MSPTQILQAMVERTRYREALEFIALQHPAGCEEDKRHWACGIARQALSPNPSETGAE